MSYKLWLLSYKLWLLSLSYELRLLNYENWVMSKPNRPLVLDVRFKSGYSSSAQLIFFTKYFKRSGFKLQCSTKTFALPFLNLYLSTSSRTSFFCPTQVVGRGWDKILALITRQCNDGFRH